MSWMLAYMAVMYGVSGLLTIMAVAESRRHRAPVRDVRLSNETGLRALMEISVTAVFWPVFIATIMLPSASDVWTWLTEAP